MNWIEITLGIANLVTILIVIPMGKFIYTLFSQIDKLHSNDLHEIRDWMKYIEQKLDTHIMNRDVHNGH